MNITALNPRQALNKSQAAIKSAKKSTQAHFQNRLNSTNAQTFG
jgi:hypothetical protein